MLKQICWAGLILVWFNSILLQSLAATLSPGLVVQATDGRRSVVYVASTPNFSLTPRQSIHPQLQPEFKAVWTGFLKVVRAGHYTIHGGAKIFVNGQAVPGQDIQLEAGEFPFRLEFEREPGAPVRLQLEWQSDFFKREPIPASVFGHREQPAEVALHAKVARGRELLEELNCVGQVNISSSVGPLTDGRIKIATGGPVRFEVTILAK